MPAQGNIVTIRNLSKLYRQGEINVTALDKSYEGFVRKLRRKRAARKGPLQIKVQIQQPDKFLTPELSAKVEFLK